MIKVKNLSKQYDAGMVKALTEISLEIARGEVCSVMGPSGCGKSTLLNLIGALDKPTAGEILIDGRFLTDLSLVRYRRYVVGFIFQQHHLIPNLTLLENVALPLLARRDLGSRQRSRLAMELLGEVDLLSRVSFYPAQVSGGERQRAAVARALVNQPAILLADEPTGSVDSVTANLIMEAVLRRCRGDGMTALIVTHNPEIADQSERKIFMRDGRVGE